jgi:ADP-ribosylglycohydrolase
MKNPDNYLERVYAGWLGKCIGVRFGAPLENWTYEEIRDNLGELKGYVAEDRNKLFKPDDDTSVPMILLRAVEDNMGNLTAESIGDTLLNYIGYEHGSFWWGGYGASTEHTAYLNLFHGIPAPRSGSIAQNGATLAEQIGGQIFSDIWGLLFPNNPKVAADYAEKAASVSHDGNGLYGARFLAAMVSAAFSESNPKRLIEIGLEQVPPDSEYARVINAMCQFHAEHPENWHEGFAYLKANFGYDRYSGIVHIIPNAGVIALGLLYGEGDFSRSIQITNMAGWDTDCNVGNVGAIMGVALGLDCIDASWREPMNDLLITASLIGTRNLLTIPQCVDLMYRLNHQMHGRNYVNFPRYHFLHRGSTNNFQVSGDKGRPIHFLQADYGKQPVLKVAIRKLNKKGQIRIFTRTHYRPRELSSNYYGASFTPLLYSGQTIRAIVSTPKHAPESLWAAIFVYDDNQKKYYQGEALPLIAAESHELNFTVPPLEDACLSQVGIVLRNTGEIWETGSFHLETLDWSETPEFSSTFAYAKPETGAISEWTYWRGYWRLEDGVYHGSGIEENESYTGDISWKDYQFSAELRPIIGEHHLLMFRVQGAMRSYAFGLSPNNTITLYKKSRHYKPLQSADFAWEHDKDYLLTVSVKGNRILAKIEAEGQSHRIEWEDSDAPYLNGQIGLASWHGSHTAFKRIEFGKETAW